MRMKKMSALLAVPFLAFSLAACGGSGGSVSKEQFVDGFVKEASEQGFELPGGDDEQLKKYAGCIYDKVKDDVSSESLKAVANGKADDVKKDDRDAFQESIEPCAKELTGDLKDLG